MKKLYSLIILFSFFLASSQNNLIANLNELNYKGNINPLNLIKYKNKIYFSGFRGDKNGGNELWSYDPEDNSAEIIKNFQIFQESGSRIKSNFVLYNDQMYFIATNTFPLVNQLWVTDGTSAGTKFVSNLNASSTIYDNLLKIVVTGNKLFFRIQSTLWSSDGTEDGTHRIGDFNTYSDSSFTETDGKILFMSYDYDANYNGKDNLYKTDGTAEGTSVVRSFERDNTSYGNNKMIAYQGKTYFVGAENGKKYLWKTDGSIDGTEKIKEVETRILSNAKIFGNKIIFNGENNKVWSSDGTIENTKVITQIQDNITGMHLYKNEIYVDTDKNMVKIGSDLQTVSQVSFDAENTFYKILNVSTEGNYLILQKEQLMYYKDPILAFDGQVTKEMKYPVHFFSEINFNDNNAYPFLEFGTKIFYNGYFDDQGNELFSYEFSNQEEELTVDLNYETDSAPFNYLTIGKDDYFMARTNSYYQIVKRNQDTKITTIVSDFQDNNFFPDKKLAVGNHYIAYSTSFWFYKSSGTKESSAVIKIPTGTIMGLYKLNDQNIAITTRNEYNVQLYKYDLASNHFTLLAEKPRNTSIYNYDGNAALINNELYFTFFDDSSHLSIWKTDGTVAGTKKAIDFPFFNLQYLRILGEVNSKVIFNISDGSYNQYNLYAGTENNTAATLLRQLTTPLNDNPTIYKDRLYFLTMGSSAATSLYATDGSTSGTVFIKSIGYDLSQQTDPFRKCNNLLYFKPFYNSIWKTDGTALGTRSLTSISSYGLACANDYIYTVRETSDGIPKTLVRLNSAGVSSFSFQVNKDNMFYSKGDGAAHLSELYGNGKELYVSNIMEHYSGLEQSIISEGLEPWLSVNDENHINKERILVYPNPSSDFINIKLDSTEKLIKVEILDLSGKLILHLEKPDTKIKVNSLSVGNYMIKVTTESGVKSSKFIKY